MTKTEQNRVLAWRLKVLRYRHPGFSLFQNRHDLRFGELRLLYWTSLRPKILPERSSCCGLPVGEAYDSFRNRPCKIEKHVCMLRVRSMACISPV